MSDQQIRLLAGIAAALLVVTALLYSGISFGGDDFRPGTALLIGLDPAKIAGIAITSSSGSVSLERTGEGFAITDRDGYPASMQKINELIVTCLDIRLTGKVSDSADAHENLGVGEKSPEAMTVTFTGEDGKTIAGFIRGKSPESGGVWLRRLDSPTTFVSDQFNIDTAPTAYLDTQLVKLNKEEIEEVTVEVGSQTVTILRGADKKPSLRNIPAGRDADDDAVTETFDVLADLHFEDITPLADKTLQWDGLYRCRMASGLVYLVRTAKDGEQFYAQVQAVGPQVSEIQIDQDESDADLKKKEAILLAVDTANEINQVAGSWIFKLSSWQAEKLRTPMEDLLEEKE